MALSRLSDDEMTSLFHVFDNNCTGTISPEELANLFRSLGWAEVSVEHCDDLLVENFGLQCQGVTLEQFKTLVPKIVLQPDSPFECYQAFKLFDMSHNDKISFEDLKAAGEIATGGPVPDALVKAIMMVADTDEDGFLSLSEFRSACAKGGAGTENGFLDVSEEASLESTARGRLRTLGDTLQNAELEAATNEAEPAPESEEEQVVEPEPTERQIGGVTVPVSRNRVTKADVRAALTELGYGSDQLSDEDFEMIFDDYDRNRDGMLEIDEYREMLVGLGENVE